MRYLILCATLGLVFFGVLPDPTGMVVPKSQTIVGGIGSFDQKVTYVEEPNWPFAGNITGVKYTLTLNGCEDAGIVWDEQEDVIGRRCMYETRQSGDSVTVRLVCNHRLPSRYELPEMKLLSVRPDGGKSCVIEAENVLVRFSSNRFGAWLPGDGARSEIRVD